MPASPSARRRLGSLVLALAVFAIQTAPVIATEITTDLWVYQYGDTVTVTGIDFGANETVEIVTTDPYAVEVDRGQAQTDGAGAFTYQFILLSDVPGIYDVVATGLTSGLFASTQFDPANFALVANAPAAVQYSDYVTFSGTFTCTKTTGGGNCPTTAAGMAGSTVEALVQINPPGPDPLDYYVVASTVIASGDCIIHSTTTSNGLKATCNWSISWQAGRTSGSHSVAPGIYNMRFRATGGPTDNPAGSNSTKDDSRSITINSESSSTEYLGDLSATEGTSLNLSADVDDLDGGIGLGNGVFSPDPNLAATDVVSFELLPNSGCSGSTLALVYADIDGDGMTTGSPTMDLTGIGAGTYYLSTAYNGTLAAFYSPSADCDQVTIESAADAAAPTDASIDINDGDAWTNTPNVSLDISANDNVGITRYRLAESQAGLDAAADVVVSPAEAAFSRLNVPFTLTGFDAAAKAVWLRVCDAADNCADTSDTIGLDTAAPSVSLSINTGAAWTNDPNVTLGVVASDATSGLDSYGFGESDPADTCPQGTAGDPTGSHPFMLTGGDADSKPVFIAVCDLAGNFAQATDDIGLDTVAPLVTMVINGDAAWTNSLSVSLDVTASDERSGLASYGFTETDPADTCPQGTAGDPNGSNAFNLTGADADAKPAYAAVCDAAGNFAQGTDSIGLDRVKPTADPDGFADGDVFHLGDALPLPASCTTADDRSGVATAASASVVDNRNVNGVGSVDVTCSGHLDNAGNAGDPVTDTFYVQYDPDSLSGILQPINPDNSSVFKRGQAVPVKFRIDGDEPNGFDTSGWQVFAMRVGCALVPDDGTLELIASVTPNPYIRYDMASDQYIYNADFRSAPNPSCWKIRVVFDDDGPGNMPPPTTMDSAVFKVQK